jgi:DNA invertase Pin-like site-specific DNA recombinase
LRDHGVGLYVHSEQIDTASSGFALLDLIRAYRRAKLSQAIRNGQAKALLAGKRVGRPTVPRDIVTRIQAALTEGGGIRPTDRVYVVSPASLINIRGR